jgi:glycosyltransferase involved in cell wall biosynthesis
MTKVAHLTTLHPAFDNRIFLRECRSLARAGYEVVLVAPHEGAETVDAVRIRPVPKPHNRLDRLLHQGRRVYRCALEEQADIYHFHDPDLLPWALLLRLRTGRPVIYDVHEDYVTSLTYKPYFPLWLGRLVGRAYGGLEQATRAAFKIVIAERYYARRFPDAVPVLNYPDQGVLDELLGQPRQRPDGDRIRLLYTGSASAMRGALAMAELACELPEGGSVTMIGACAPDVLRAVRERCPRPGRLHIEGDAGHVPYRRIVAAYREPWTAALALFPDSPHVREKELTKFFEYMAAGLPIICSDFPVWRDLVERTGAGVCVPPGDAGAALAAVMDLVRDPERARAMSLAGQNAARTRFSWETQACRLVELYGELAPLAKTSPLPA